MTSIYKDLRIVLVVKTGAGKSAILSEEVCREELSTEARIERGQRDVNGQIISVTDAAGWFDASVSEQMKREIQRRVEESVPGPHVFLLIDRYTDEVKNTVQWIQENFGEEAACHTIVLFARGDQIDGLIDKCLNANQLLKELVKKYPKVYVFENNYEENPLQEMEDTSDRMEENIGDVDEMLKENQRGEEEKEERDEDREKEEKEKKKREKEEKRVEDEEELSLSQKVAFVCAGVIGGTIGAVGAAAGGFAHVAAALVAASMILIAAVSVAMMTE